MMDRVADLDCDALPAVDECRASDVRATDCGPNPSLDTAEDGAPWMSMRDVCSELHAPEPLGDTLAGARMGRRLGTGDRVFLADRT
ncbi:hypothetical protein [Trinickia caryophylli]|uniref:hypothetical protein n=1 Tax=Trinickia caryophylli TaxID=28094 RepID=UPI0014781419|nr:hypothetical protein [Trinickia caryophylli]